MQYVYLGITLFVSLTVTLHVNALIERWVNRWLSKRNAPKCDVCGINSPCMTVMTITDGVPKGTMMCRECAVEANELRNAE